MTPLLTAGITASFTAHGLDVNIILRPVPQGHPLEGAWRVSISGQDREIQLGRSQSANSWASIIFRRRKDAWTIAIAHENGRHMLAQLLTDDYTERLPPTDIVDHEVNMTETEAVAFMDHLLARIRTSSAR